MVYRIYYKYAAIVEVVYKNKIVGCVYVVFVCLFVYVSNMFEPYQLGMSLCACVCMWILVAIRRPWAYLIARVRAQSVREREILHTY